MVDVIRDWLMRALKTGKTAKFEKMSVIHKSWTDPLAVVVILLGIIAHTAYSQNAFSNLDFEHPIEPLIRAGDFMVPTADGVPGWTVFLGSNPDTRMPYNTASFGAPAVSLQGPESQYVLQGNYTVLLQGEWLNQQTPASIAQTGQIPAGSLGV